MEQQATLTALVYDFDGTLARGNMHEPSFIPKIGVEAASFWSEVKAYTKEYDADEILTYMWRMLELAKKKGLAITRKALEEHGRGLPLFNGLETWFQRINSYGSSRGLGIEHYIISSGIHEMICGCDIFAHFSRVFASKFIYNSEGEAIWPGVAINYTTKTQFLFRINKGIENTWDNEQINRWIPMKERRVPFERIVFIGDGATDIPSMKMVRH